MLDFGFGGGTGAKYFIKFLNEDGHLTCVDVADYWRNKARERLKKYPNGELNIHDSSFNAISIIHVIHDIEPKKRKDTINKLVQKLKNNGMPFIKEPIKNSHGRPVNEIQSLLYS